MTRSTYHQKYVCVLWLFQLNPPQEPAKGRKGKQSVAAAAAAAAGGAEPSRRQVTLLPAAQLAACTLGR